MPLLAVVEQKGENISNIIAGGLTAAAHTGALPKIISVRPGGLKKIRGAELIVFSPKSAAPEALGTKCSYLLSPPSALGLVKAECAVSYGLSASNAITVSSLTENRCIISLQQELQTLSGKVLEHQDIPLTRSAGMSPEGLLAAAGALLIYGVPPEML